MDDAKRSKESAIADHGSLLRVTSRRFTDDVAPLIQRRPKLTFTRPKESLPKTAYRVHAVRVKGSGELEKEMLANIPKFKARPLNKKEFHLKMMKRDNQHADTLSSFSYTKDSSSKNQGKSKQLAERAPSHLDTALRARPSKVESCEDMEPEELENIPKFKARRLNKKIIDGRGCLESFSNPNPQATTPQEFHLAMNERMRLPETVLELFDKLSLHRKSHQDQKEVPRITVPDPFHRHTEERGIKKEKKFAEQILQQQLEEEIARIPKAGLYPYTTDYPAIPPKPEPKQCTKTEAFQLESLVRHEEEMHRKLEEEKGLEKEKAQRRLFKAQPIMKHDPFPLPERERKPLTEVQEFPLHVDNRAAHRLEFDKKIKEKEMAYKRLLEDREAAKMVEEEEAVKRLRRIMVPRARPLPKFDNPFLLQKSFMETTKPRSLNLHVKQRKERQHGFHISCLP